MKRYLTVGVVFGVLVVIVVISSWVMFPAWKNPASGGFWTLLGLVIVGVFTFVKDMVSVWKDLGEKNEESKKLVSPPLQSINTQKADVIYNAPGGTITVNEENSIGSVHHKQGFILPKLGLKLINSLNQYVDQLTFSQTVNNQDFHFGIALINSAEGSAPAEKLEITVKCSWDGVDIKNAPKFRTDMYNRTTPGWTTTREFVQQGEAPYPAVLSFHGTVNDRCAYEHNLEWFRFSVILFERMHGCFMLNYKITSAYPELVTNQGTLLILIDSQK